MAGRRYWVDIAPTAVTVATTDLLELKAAAEKPIRVVSLQLHQTSDFGDAQSEILSLKWVRGNTTSGSGGSSVTPRPGNPSDAAAGFTAESFNTTPASTGTPINLARHGFNAQAGIERPYTPEEDIITSGTLYLCLRLESAPADSLTIAGSVCVEEMG